MRGRQRKGRPRSRWEAASTDLAGSCWWDSCEGRLPPTPRKFYWRKVGIGGCRCTLALSLSWDMSCCRTFACTPCMCLFRSFSGGRPKPTSLPGQRLRHSDRALASKTSRLDHSAHIAGGVCVRRCDWGRRARLARRLLLAGLPLACAVCAAPSRRCLSSPLFRWPQH